MPSNKNIKTKVIKVFLPVLLGGLFYIYFAPNTYFVRFIAYNLGVNEGINTDIRNNQILTFIRNYGLDMLWSYSLACSIMWITSKKQTSLIIASFFSIGMELLQLVNSKLGTFDILDIIFELFSIFIAVYFWNDNSKKQNQ